MPIIIKHGPSLTCMASGVDTVRPEYSNAIDVPGYRSSVSNENLSHCRYFDNRRPTRVQSAHGAQSQTIDLDHGLEQTYVLGGGNFKSF